MYRRLYAYFSFSIDFPIFFLFLAHRFLASQHGKSCNAVVGYLVFIISHTQACTNHNSPMEFKIIAKPRGKKNKHRIRVGNCHFGWWWPKKQNQSTVEIDYKNKSCNFWCNTTRMQHCLQHGSGQATANFKLVNKNNSNNNYKLCIPKSVLFVVVFFMKFSLLWYAVIRCDVMN